ncbi:hypothetical protein Vadar_004642 [Vaccinium darrowii]|uniref:Uncharacterized protein n=1 Tax=Vaccinium darrowii TaxID=229202 RepID=A0ACB7Z1Q3_9ERIC|nr:hypothetical protein Vadar_004642 [Vaccinium darrowii]
MGHALPITAMNVLLYVKAVVSELFLGWLGSLELAGGALSISFTNITSYSVLKGLSSGLELVCNQAYGSKNWDLLSLPLQRMIFILLMAIVPITFLLVNLESIMIFMGQDPKITATAAGDFPHTAELCTGGGDWVGVKGVVVASVVTNLHMVALIAGPRLAVAATGVMIQTTSLMYTMPMALAGCVSPRVGKELGAGKPYKAKLAATVALGCTLVIGFINVIWTVIFREKWGALFTTDELVKALVAAVMPIMGLCELGNCGGLFAGESSLDL